VILTKQIEIVSDRVFWRYATGVDLHENSCRPRFRARVDEFLRVSQFSFDWPIFNAGRFWRVCLGIERVDGLDAGGKAFAAQFAGNGAGVVENICARLAHDHDHRRVIAKADKPALGPLFIFYLGIIIRKSV